MNNNAAIRIETADYPRQHEQLHALRRAVFVDEQRIAAELETDELDPVSHHVIALTATGQIVGTDVYPFDDAEQASVAVAALDGKI